MASEQLIYKLKINHKKCSKQTSYCLELNSSFCQTKTFTEFTWSRTKFVAFVFIDTKIPISETPNF